MLQTQTYPLRKVHFDALDANVLGATRHIGDRLFRGSLVDSARHLCRLRTRPLRKWRGSEPNCVFWAQIFLFHHISTSLQVDLRTRLHAT